jgi:hypothetical protein
MSSPEPRPKRRNGISLGTSLVIVAAIAAEEQAGNKFPVWHCGRVLVAGTLRVCDFFTLSLDLITCSRYN